VIYRSDSHRIELSVGYAHNEASKTCPASHRLDGRCSSCAETWLLGDRDGPFPRTAESPTILRDV
jgi:hypothetical protein